MGKNTVKTNEWRVIKPCSNCPLMDDGKAIHFNPGRVDEIKEHLRNGGNFVCHKTSYDLDINMEPGEIQQPKMCAGAYLYLKSINKPNQLMRIVKAYGKD